MKGGCLPGCLLIIVLLTCAYFFLRSSEFITPPLMVTTRVALTRGQVLQITNLSSEIKEICVYGSDGTRRSKTFKFALKPGEEREVGFLELEGWFLDTNEYAVISTPKCLFDIKTSFISDGSCEIDKFYHWSLEPEYDPEAIGTQPVED